MFVYHLLVNERLSLASRQQRVTLSLRVDGKALAKITSAATASVASLIIIETDYLITGRRGVFDVSTLITIF